MICRSCIPAFAILVSLTASCSDPGYTDHTEHTGGAELSQKAAPKPARTAAVPAMCSDFPNLKQCPGVRHTEPLECPKTDVLVRLPPNSACLDRVPGEGGAWEGGSVLGALEAELPGPTLCSYHWTAPPNAPPDPTYFKNNLSDENWEWDCPRVAAHGDELNAALTAHGKDYVGEIQWNTPVSTPVRVAVVDTAAGSWQDPDNNPHGKAVGVLVRDTACTDLASCNVRVENFLGLPLIRDSESVPGQTIIRLDRARGGGFGGHGWLARAIVRAANAAPADVPTVINLSLGYDAPELTAPIPDADDLSNRAVLEALQYARCRGALILAAAGNGPVPARPGQTAAFPARWSSLPGLDTQRCQDRYGIARHTSTAHPLLYAVSGVDFGDRPLLTTRADGQSAIAALGFAVVREDPNGGYTRILTGSSMATATVSGVAAAYWGTFLASVSPDRIIRDLYDHSPDVAAAVDFIPYSDPQSPKFFTSVRRIDRCSIAETTRAPADCVVRPDASSTVPDSVVPELPEDALSVEPAPHSERELGVTPQEYPWILPQPDGEPGCTSCSLKLLNARLQLILRSDFAARNNALQLLLRRAGVARIANLRKPGDDVEPVADFDAQTVPFTVDLSDQNLGAPSAAELSYQVTVEGVIVDVTEPVLIEADEAP